MEKLSAFILFTILFFSIVLVHSEPVNEYYLITIVVKAPSTHSIPANYPIVVELKTLAAALPKGEVDVFGVTKTEEDDIDWNTAAVLHGDHVIPSQIDDLDLNGFSEEDELVFLTVKPIPAGQSNEYKVFVAKKVSKLPKVSFPIKVRVKEYGLISRIKKESPEFMSEAYDLSNGLITATVAVKAAWMSGAIFSIVVNKTGYDIVKQSSEYMSLLWKWSRLFCPADPGWIEHNPDAMTGGGKVVFMKEGPVRGIIKVVLTASYYNLTDVYPVFTYILYVNQTWIYAYLDITGKNAKPGMFLEVNLANREWGGVGKGGLYKLVIVSGAGNFSRREDVKVPVSLIKEGWYISTDPSMKKGFVFIFPTLGLDSVLWSFDDEGIHTYYTAMSFPYKSIIAVFDENITNNPVEYAEKVYREYFAVSPTIIVKPAEKISSLPGELAKMKEIFELQSAVTELEKKIENMSKQIASLRSTKEKLELTVYRTRILVAVLLAVIFVVGYVAGRGRAYRKKGVRKHEE